MRLATMARSLASAMNSAGVRLDVLADMRASPRVDHSLILGDYLSEPRAGELLDGSANELGMTGPEKDVPLVPDIDHPNFDPLRWLLHYKSLIAGGLRAYVHGWEMDPGWALNADDDLGTQEILPQDSGVVKEFEHKGDPAMELTLVWEVEDPEDDDETQGRGRSG